MMTSRERMLAAMRNQPVDRLPCGPFGIGGLTFDDPLAQELILKTDCFLKTRAAGNPVLGGRAAVDVAECDGETVWTLHTPRGDLVRRIGHTEVARATREYPLKTLDDIEKLFSVPYEEPMIDATAYIGMKHRYDDDAIVLCDIGNAVAVPADWFGPEMFCYFWATARERIIELTQRMNERVCRFVARCCERGVTDFRIVGGEYVSVQIGPAGMPELIRGPDRKLIDIIHAHGGIAFYHNHGPMMRFLEDYAHIGVDFLEPLEAPPWGDVHLGRAKEIIGDRFCMVGNLDDMEIVNKFDADAVCEIARQRIAEAGTRGFILSGTSSGTFTEKGARNFIAMAESVSRS